MNNEFINIALPKGRLGEKAYSILEEAGYACPEIYEGGRKLIFENADARVRYFWVKPTDVSVYVEKQAADVGIVGLDILLETKPDIYELLNLGIGKCRMAIAAKKGAHLPLDRELRVATKFPNIAKNHYFAQGRDIEIIKLNGSIELAPILGLSDVIADIVETGKTLYENNLEVIEDIVNISARFVANKSSFKFKTEEIRTMAENLRRVCEAKEKSNDKD